MRDERDLELHTPLWVLAKPESIEAKGIERAALTVKDPKSGEPLLLLFDNPDLAEKSASEQRNTSGIVAVALETNESVLSVLDYFLSQGLTDAAFSHSSESEWKRVELDAIRESFAE